MTSTLLDLFKKKNKNSISKCYFSNQNEMFYMIDDVSERKKKEKRKRKELLMSGITCKTRSKHDSQSLQDNRGRFLKKMLRKSSLS